MAEVEGDDVTAVAFAEPFAPEVFPPGLKCHSRNLSSLHTSGPQPQIGHLVLFLRHGPMEVVVSCSSTMSNRNYDPGLLIRFY